MGEHIDFWQTLAPYWLHIEDNYLDLDSIRKLIPDIEAPALVVGAGQGLLVEQLRKNGFDVDGVDSAPYMIRYAKERRKLNLFQADGSSMPFADGSYKSSVIATGVVDFMDDETRIASIIRETCRVTNETGTVFVAFYRFDPKVEKFLTYLRLVGPEGLYCFRDAIKMLSLGPLDSIIAVKTRTNARFFSAFAIVAKVQLFFPRKEKAGNKNWKKILRLANQDLGSIDNVIDSAPEYLPYRNEERIRTLLTSLGFCIGGITDFNTCYVVRLVRNQQ